MPHLLQPRPLLVSLATIALLGGCVSTTTTKRTTGKVTKNAHSHLSLMAFGQSPKWTVTINQAKLAYSSADTEGTKTGSYVQKINGNTGAIVVTSSSPELSLSLTKKECRAEGKTYPMTAVLEKDGASYNGCAETAAKAPK